jgi:chloramphenicol O-acetyltransferase
MIIQFQKKNGPEERKEGEGKEGNCIESCIPNFEYYTFSVNFQLPEANEVALHVQ